MSDDKPTSIWKKEISFRRKAADDAEKTSIWKKEISFGKRRGEEPEVAPAPPVPVTPEPVAVQPVPEPTPEPEPVALAPVPVVHDWLTQPLEEVSEPPAEPPLEPAPITLVPVPDPPAAPEPEPVPELPRLPELPSVPDLPPVAAAPPPVALPTDLPTAELPALPGPAPQAPAAEAAHEPKVPFYKKELSLKRKPRDPKPPKQPREPRKRRERSAAESPDGPKKTPFYRRELSLKRGPRQWDAAEPLAEPKPRPKPKVARLPRPRPSVPRGGGVKKIVGLKIGGSQIAAARVHNNGGPELVQAVRAPLEQGIVVGGELRDPEALAAALKEFFVRHKLPRRGVRLGIANNRIGVRTFEVTGIDDPKQLANAIRFRAQEVLPIPIEEAVLDYQVLEESVNDEGQPVRKVLLVVAYRELVDRYLHACRKAGIQVVGVDLEAFALLRAVSEQQDPPPGVDRGAVVAVSVGHDRSTFAVSDGRVCEFTRVLEWGGAALNVAIARALDISPSEAEPIKRSLSLAGTAELPEGVDPHQLATAREAATRQLQTFARELVSSLQFYQNQPGSLGIGEIALTGGTAHLPGLGAELERLIGVPVRVADPLARVKVSRKLQEPEQVGSLAIAIGLGIEL